MNNEELFRELLERHLADDLRPGEEKSLVQMINDPSYEAVLTEFLREAYEEVRSGDTVPEWTGQFLDGLRQRMEREDGGAGTVGNGGGAGTGVGTGAGDVVAGLKEKRVFHISRWLAAAACVLLLAGVYVLRYRSGPATGGLRAPMDIGPGKDMAVLTLADGRRIALDSSSADTISAAPGVPVINFKGKLAFNSGEARGAAGGTGSGSGAGMGSGSGAGTETQYNTISTARGNQYQLILPDGSQVWLNAASSLRFPTTFGKGERRVELTGEGYFAVVHDAAHPFVVAFNHMEVKDLGTEFNIMAYSDEPVTQAGLVKGSIAVSYEGKQAVLKDPGKMAVAGNGAGSSAGSGVGGGGPTPAGNKDLQIETGDPEQFAAWKNGQISFSNVDLPTLLREISRWYDVDVVYAGTVPLQHFGGLISRNIRLSTMLDILNKSGVNIRQEGRKLVVAPGKRG